MENFSVLMSVYKNEKAEYLELAIDSILKQTIVPNEIVIVKDGTLTHELEMILDKFSTKYEFFKFLEFKENRGLGLALRDGVLSCSNELIARMDTDDISKLERFEKQLTYIANHPEVAVLGTCIEEFSKNINAPDSATILPLTHDEIVKFSKKRNPFRHMTVLFKRSAVISSGNYRDFLWFEDYHLWLRLMKKGYIMANLHDVLVSVRADDDTPASDRQALMWVAMCRYYALVGEFANEVLRERYLMGFSTLTKDDYDRFIQAQSMWHPELEELSALTAGKLRSNVFKAMSEAELWEKESDTLLPSLLSKSVTAILENRPESFRFFPTRER